MRYRFTILAASLALMITEATRAQERGGTATSSSSAVSTAASSPADKAFEPLQRDFANLFQSLQNAGGAGKEDRPAIQALRDRFAAFGKQFPSDQRGLAAERTLSEWLDDQAGVDAAFERLIKARPDDQKMRLDYARRLERVNRFADTIKVLNGVNWSDENVIDAKLLLSESLFAEQRFQEAVDALTGIPDSVLTNNLPRKAEVDSVLQQRREYIELWSAEQALRDGEEKANDLPRVEIVTAKGPIVVELFENEAPNTVANFIKLADSKFYDSSKFHRVIPKFMSQGGDPNSKPGATGMPGGGNPGYYIPDEVQRENARKHFTGSLAMAKTAEPDTGGCQFYITHLPTAWLNGKHTVFGRVVSGEEAARSLKNNDVIETMNVLRKRDHAYEPTTLPLVKPAATVPSTIPATTSPASTIPATQP